MSFILKNNGVQVAISGAWHPSLFAKHTGTSFPEEVTQEYIWQQDEYTLAWVDDEQALPPSEDLILANQKSERAEAYRLEADPIFFKYQRGEATFDDWLNKVNEIRKRYSP